MNAKGVCVPLCVYKHYATSEPGKQTLLS